MCENSTLCKIPKDCQKRHPKDCKHVFNRKGFRFGNECFYNHQTQTKQDVNIKKVDLLECIVTESPSPSLMQDNKCNEETHQQ